MLVLHVVALPATSQSRPDSLSQVKVLKKAPSVEMARHPVPILRAGSSCVCYKGVQHGQLWGLPDSPTRRGVLQLRHRVRLLIPTVFQEVQPSPHRELAGPGAPVASMPSWGLMRDTQVTLRSGSG